MKEENLKVFYKSEFFLMKIITLTPGFDKAAYTLALMVVNKRGSFGTENTLEKLI